MPDEERQDLSCISEQEIEEISIVGLLLRKCRLNDQRGELLVVLEVKATRTGKG